MRGAQTSAVGIGVVAVLLGLVACAGGHSAAAARAPVPAAPARGKAIGARAVLSRAGAAGTVGRGLDGLTLARLASLTDYAFRVTVANGVKPLIVTGEIHSPVDFAVHSLGTTIYAGGHAYERLGALVEPIALNPAHFLAGTGQAVFASQFLADTHITGATVREGPACTVAGVHGRTYTLLTHDGGRVLHERERMCVADASGAMLRYTSVIGGSVIPHPAGGSVGNTFTVTAVGDVPVIRAPQLPGRPVPASPKSVSHTLPSVAASAPGFVAKLPAAFPSVVPPPPGTIQLSSVSGQPASTWYVQSTLTGEAELQAYVGRLRAQGFRLQGREQLTPSAQGTVDVVLTDARFDVTLTGSSLPEIGFVLGTTVVASGSDGAPAAR